MPIWIRLKDKLTFEAFNHVENNYFMFWFYFVGTDRNLSWTGMINGWHNYVSGPLTVNLRLVLGKMERFKVQNHEQKPVYDNILLRKKINLLKFWKSFYRSRVSLHQPVFECVWKRHVAESCQSILRSCVEELGINTFHPPNLISAWQRLIHMFQSVRHIMTISSDLSDILDMLLGFNHYFQKDGFDHVLDES